MGYKSGLGCARDRNVHGPGNTPKAESNNIANESLKTQLFL